jgi:hypothetical protein
MPENSKTLDFLLRFIYPSTANPELVDLNDLPDLLRATDKFFLQEMHAYLRSALLSHSLVKSDVIKVYCIAFHNNLPEEVKALSRIALKENRNWYTKRMDNRNFELYYLRLFRFHQERAETVQGILENHIPDSCSHICMECHYYRRKMKEELEATESEKRASICQQEDRRYRAWASGVEYDDSWDEEPCGDFEKHDLPRWWDIFRSKARQHSCPSSNSLFSAEVVMDRIAESSCGSCWKKGSRWMKMLDEVKKVVDALPDCIDLAEYGTCKPWF